MQWVLAGTFALAVGCALTAGAGRPAALPASGPAVGGPYSGQNTARAAEVRDGAELLRAMHDRYAQDWYDTLSFQQDAITHHDDRKDTKEIWYEAAMLPGKLRIDITSPNGDAQSGYQPGTTLKGDSHGMLVADGTITIFKNGAVTAQQPFVHMLLVLGFDVYKQPAETTIEQVKKEGFDLSKMHEETWEGEPVYVVGADKGDLKTKQFWIEKKRLLFLRLIQPDRQDATKTSDSRFMDYRKLSTGLVAARVEFYVDGKNEFSEIYANMKANPKLDPSFFDPKQFKPQENTQK
jgi:hypothetical protein